MQIIEAYMNKENRDKRFKELKAQGHAVIKRSSSNQLMHPQYIMDYPNKDIQADNGIGNGYYKTHFAKIYKIESAY